jgi:hypothetical protein
MSYVQRVSAPAVVHLRMMYTSVVPLSEPPTREWEVLFRQPLDFTSVYHPNRIRIEKGRLAFESEEQQVPTWLHYIDKWIASANQRLAARQAGRDILPAGGPAWSAPELESARA